MITYDEEDLGGSVTVRSVKDFGSIVVVVVVVDGVCVYGGLLRRFNFTKRHRFLRERKREKKKKKN